MATQKAHGGGKRSFRSNRKGIVGHDFFYRVALGEFIDLFRARDQHARGIGVPDVSVGDDSHQVIIVEHRQLVDPMFRHQLSGYDDTVEGFHREHTLGHPIRHSDGLC